MSAMPLLDNFHSVRCFIIIGVKVDVTYIYLYMYTWLRLMILSRSFELLLKVHENNPTYNSDLNTWFDFHSSKNAVNKKKWNGIRVQFDRMLEFEPNDWIDTVSANAVMILMTRCNNLTLLFYYIWRSNCIEINPRNGQIRRINLKNSVQQTLNSNKEKKNEFLANSSQNLQFSFITIDF